MEIGWKELEIENCEIVIARLEKEIDELKKKGDAESTRMIRSKENDIKMYYTDIETAKKQMLEPQKKLASHSCR